MPVLQNPDGTIDVIIPGTFEMGDCNGITLLDYCGGSEPDAWALVRKIRNALLAECDYTQVVDYPGASEPWRVYRQSLRDIPEYFLLVQDVVFPVTPSIELT